MRLKIYPGTTEDRMRVEAAKKRITPTSYVNRAVKDTVEASSDPVRVHLERALAELKGLPALPGTEAIVASVSRQAIDTTARKAIRGEISRTLGVWRDRPWTHWDASGDA